MPVTVAMGNAYYVFFMPMVIATRMRMSTVMGMPMTMCTGTYTIGKHASRPALHPKDITSNILDVVTRMFLYRVFFNLLSTKKIRVS